MTSPHKTSLIYLDLYVKSKWVSKGKMKGVNKEVIRKL